MELVYKHKKWDKQLQIDEKMWKELGGFSSVNNLNGVIKVQQLKTPVDRNYQLLYSACSIFYASTAKSYYLRNTEDLQSLYYTYLSSRSAILERLFASLYIRKGRKIFDAQDGIDQFDYHILQTIAIGQPLPKCIQGIDNIYIQLLNKDVQNVEKYLKSREDKAGSENIFGNKLSEIECKDIQMILQGDKVSLRNRLIQRIKEYRKEPIDYFEIIDIYATAMLKLARKYGMDIDIDVIEIPKLFFDKERCKINQAEIEVPFFEDALEVLKENGISWDE
ncbi:MAG: hypothetical protein J6J79_08105 [Lachnospiraceae bacterium]|nr:hypothetical protein [Lachnospiraceae bacterium]